MWCLTDKPIGHLHEDVILLLRPESFRGLLSCANLGFCHWNLCWITKFEYERENEKDSWSPWVVTWRHRANGLLIDESDCDNIQVTQLGSQQQPMYSGMILPILPKLSINRGKACFPCTIYTYAFYGFHPYVCLNLYVYRLEEADRADDSFQ